MIFDTVAEYDAEITTVQEDITRQLMLGASHKSDSGGASRETTEVTLSQLRAYRSQLKRERALLDPDTNGAVVIGARW